MKSSDPEKSLASILTDWRIEPTRDASFRTAVWSKIEATRRPTGWPAYVKARPAVVAGACVLGVLLGALTGREQAKARMAAESAAMANRYVQGLDARSMRLP